VVYVRNDNNDRRQTLTRVESHKLKEVGRRKGWKMKMERSFVGPENSARRDR
jgi:hypothetical protein